MSTLDWKTLVETFFAESRENLAAMERSILALESGTGDPETIHTLFRSVHTIKGASGMFDCGEVERFAHAVENTLQKLRGGAIKTSPALLDSLMASHDHLVTLLSFCEDGNDPKSDDEIIRRGNELIALLGGGMEKPEIAAGVQRLKRPRTWKISIAPGAELFRNGLDPANFIAYLAEIGDIRSITTEYHKPAGDMDPETCYLGFEILYYGTASQDELRGVFEFINGDCDIVIAPVVNGPGDTGMTGGECADSGDSMEKNHNDITPSPASGFVSGTMPARHADDARNIIRIDAGKVDTLINHVGELVISNASIVQTARDGAKTDVEDSLESMSRLIENIRESAMNIRVVPIGEAFSRFNRVVRDMSRELGKETEFTVEGGDTEIDKSIIETIMDPLMHIIRNSIDHGIEPREEREALGKPGKGHITLKAYHEAGLLVVECGDDGRGLDREKILVRARAQGLLPAARELPENEIFQVIYRAGFSTREKVTKLSGRGVGMDVVRKNIESLRGSISIKSEKGRGTMFRIKLPLTLAIIDGFIVEVGGSRYIIPLYSVTECVDINPGDLHDDEGCSYIDLRGEVLPFIRLNEFFGAGPGDNGKLSIVVVENADRRVGLAVWRFIGENQTVVKPLGRLFSKHPWISGFTILGTGEIAMILDVGKLLQNLRTNKALQYHAGHSHQVPEEISAGKHNLQG